MTFNQFKFMSELLVKINTEKLGVREAGKSIGVSAATVSRIMRGGMPDVVTLGKFCSWLEMDVNYFFNNAQKSTKKEKRQFVDARHADIVGHVDFYHCSSCNKTIPRYGEEGASTIVQYCATAKGIVSMTRVEKVYIKKNKK